MWDRMSGIRITSFVRGDAKAKRPPVHHCGSRWQATRSGCLDRASAARATSYDDREMQEFSSMAAEPNNSMQEYLELKQFLLKRTQRSAGFLTLYMLLAVSGRAALCTAIGGLGGYIYTAWLCQDIDSISAITEVPMTKANSIRDVWPRRFAKVIAGYQQQVQPRLLVPVVLAAGMAAFNSQAAEPLSLVEQGGMLVGFLSFKLAHIQYLYSQLRPKFEQPGPRRRVPDVASVQDIQMDVYGRTTKQIRAVEEADRVLAEEEARKKNRSA